MNREQEHRDLQQTLVNTPSPASLDDVLAGAQRRARKRNIVRNGIVMPLGIIMAFIIMFTASVNISPTIANAMYAIPVVRRVATAVTFPASLTDAVEHGFAQNINLEQTIDGITIRVEYAIADQQQLHIIYSVESTNRSNLRAMPALIDSWGELFSEFHQLSSSPGYFAVEFLDQLPENIQLRINVSQSAQLDPIASFIFPLEFDPVLTRQHEVITLDYTFVLDGQILTLTIVEIFPTLMRIHFEADENNTAWLRGLRFHVENENGQRFLPPADGISATGPTGCLHSPDMPMMTIHRLESAFLSESETLTMFIEEVAWLDKDSTRIRNDFAQGEAQWLPRGLRLASSERTYDGWRVKLEEYERSSFTRSFFMPSQFPFLNEEGSPVPSTWISSYCTSSGASLYIILEIADYPSAIVYFAPWFTRIEEIYTPVEIRIK